MKVELSIADDRELRAHIKDVIKGEVVAIARGEIRGIIAEVVGGMSSIPSKKKIEELAHDVMKTAVRKEFEKASYASPSFAQAEIRRQISVMLKDMINKGQLT